VRQESQQKMTAVPVIGVKFGIEENQVKLIHVFVDGPACKAGMAAGDVVLAVDGLKISMQDPGQQFARYPRGEVLKVHAFRRDELMVFDIVPEPGPKDTCILWLERGTSEFSSQLRNAWLGRNGHL
jgi:predicted metalloprotease with PDZ domain